MFVHMGYGLLCDLWVWRRRTNRRPCPPMTNPSTCSWTAWPDGSETSDFHLNILMMRQSNGCLTPSPRSSVAKLWLEQLAQKRKKNSFVCSMFRGFRAKTTGSHVALCDSNSSAESSRVLFKGSKDSASLLVCNEKTLVGVWIFCEWCRKWKTPWPTSCGSGPKPLDGSILLKFLSETRLQSQSFDTLDDLLGFQVQKLWSKVNKIFH